MRSTVLSNDTQTEIIKTLKSQALREPEVKISANKAEINHERVNLNYILCPSEKKISLLYTFLKKNRQKKIIIFFSSGMSVKYHLELLQHFDLSVTGIHVCITTKSNSFFFLNHNIPPTRINEVIKQRSKN